VLKALAKSPGKKPTDIEKDEFMSNTAISSALVSLCSKAVLKRRERGIYEFTDNLFAEWLKISETM